MSRRPVMSCVKCGSIVEVASAIGGRCCSVGCRTAVIQRHESTCLFCGVDFLGFLKDRNFCSHTCASQHHSTYKYRKCLRCGTISFRHRYCSKSCRLKAASRVPKKTRKCAACGAPCPLSRKYCSKRCRMGM